MTALAQSITSMLTPKPADPAPSSPSQLEVTSARSKTASSCELFGMLKALAAGGPDGDVGSADVDSEEDEEGALYIPESARTPTSQAESSATPHASSTMPTSESSTTVKPDEEVTAETLRRYLGNAPDNGLTALAMSNFSTLIPPGGRSTGKPSRKRPALPRSSLRPRSSSERPVSDSSSAPDSSAPDTPSTEITDDDVSSPDAVSSSSKLKAIVEDFGEVASLMQGEERERMLADSKGSLFKGVMMIGNIHLTTHRLLFHALLPPDSAFIQANDNGEGSRMRQPDVLHAGPVTVHRPNPLKPMRRLWMELSAEMVTTYPRGDEAGRVRPMRSLLLSSIRRLEPYDDDHPCEFHLSYDAADGIRQTHFTVDTEQSAMQWRRAFEGALFRYARMHWRYNEAARQGVDAKDDPVKDEWTMMRCCVPLSLVTIKGVHDYHSFATLVALDIGLDEKDRVTWEPEKIAEGDFSEGGNGKLAGLVRSATGLNMPRRSFSLKNGIPFGKSREPSPGPPRALTFNGKARGSREPSPDRAPPDRAPPDRAPVRRQSTQWIDTTVPPRLALASQLPDRDTPAGYEPGADWRNSFGFNVAVLNEQAWFVEALEAAVAAAAERKFKPGVLQPKLSIDVAGYDCLATDEEIEAQAGTSMRSGVSFEADGVERTSTGDSSNPPSDDSGTEMTRQLRKTEKASMAARMFGLEDEGIWLKRCYVGDGLVPLRGHIILSRRFVCFWRRATFGSDIKYRFRSSDIKGAREAPGIRAAFYGLSLSIHGHHDLVFEFWRKDGRDDVMARIEAMVASPPEAASENSISRSQDPLVTMMDAPIHEGIGASTRPHAADILALSKEALFRPQAFPDEALSFQPFIANRPWSASSVLTPRRFTCLTIGSRGDIQPYIALGLRLMKDGHTVTIVTHDEFKSWIEGYGITHRQAGGDPTALMKLSQEHKMFSPGFFKQSLGSFRDWLDDLLIDSWNACQDADVLIESPSTMSGIHIAEALNIPYFRAFTMPWTRTTEYPQAFMVPAFEMGTSFNYSTYVLFDNIIWRATSGQINRWRKKHLGLKSTGMSTLSVSKVPFLYNFSSAVVPKPLDWHDDVTITGYWNLENSDSEWTPPNDLEEFMAKAKEDGKAIVYIGFGSIVVPRPNAMTKSIIKAVEKAGVRAIIAKGWSSRGGDPAKEGENIEMPEGCYGLDNVPHGWLFPKIQAALHHGGAGTVGATLRAGIPTLIKPWFGDQFFWAGRVTKLEVGLKVSSLRSDDIADALVRATTDKVMIEKALRVGAKIRAENGVDNALQAIHYNIVRAGRDRTKLSWAR